MHQVVVNLCTNAYQAMSAAGGTLRVSLNQVEVDSEAVTGACQPGGIFRQKRKPYYAYFDVT